jgi:hypothetical protein
MIKKLFKNMPHPMQKNLKTKKVIINLESMPWKEKK